jgi:hypothetical protein
MLDRFAVISSGHTSSFARQWLGLLAQRTQLVMIFVTGRIDRGAANANVGHARCLVIAGCIPATANQSDL